ncbi:MAG: hypothetical protein ACR2NZ_10205 [Rubripirellula sp.]
MKKQLQLIGRVFNESGDAIAGASVVALTFDSFLRHPIEVELGEGKGLYEDAQVTETDNEGRFEFHDKLKPGSTLFVSILADGYAPLRYTHERLARDLPHDMGDLVVQKGHSISGTVVDASDAPLADVHVLMAMERGVPGHIQSYPGRGIPVAKTNSEGRFHAVGLLPGRWYLLFDKAGYRVVEHQGNFFNDPKPEELSVTLDRGSSVSGRVLNVPEQHVGKLMVEARPSRRNVDYVRQFPSRGRPRRALVQADGSFRIDGLNEEPFKPNIEPFVVQGYHSQATTRQGPLEIWLVVGLATEPNQRLFELPEVQSCRVELTSDRSETDIELPWLGRVNLSARAVDESGNPVEIQSVEVRYESGFGPDQDDQKATILPGGRIELRDYAAWDSHLQFWTPKRKVSLWIRAVGYEFCEVEIQDYLIRGQKTDFGDITLKATSEIKVRVVNSAGTAIPQAEVRLVQRNKGWTDKLTTWAHEKNERVPGSWDWNFPYHCLIAETNDEGEALLSQVDDGDEMLSGCHPDYALQVQAIAAPSDESESSRKSYPTEIRLAAPGKITVSVVDENGQPARARVYVKALDAYDDTMSGSQEMRGYQFEAESDASGIATFDRLNGRFLVALKHPEQSRRHDDQISNGERTIVEVDGNNIEVTLTVWPRYEFSVTVRESDRPIVCGSLHMMSEYLYTPDQSYKHPPFLGFTGDRGHYRFRDIPPGDYLLRVKHDDRNMIAFRKVQVGPNMEPIDWLLDNNTISGKLVDPDGTPMPHKCIAIKSELKWQTGGNRAGITYENGRGGIIWFWSGPWIQESWTDEDGSFHLRGLIANEPLHLYTSHNTLTEARLDLDPLKDGEHRKGITFVAEKRLECN